MDDQTAQQLPENFDGKKFIEALKARGRTEEEIKQLISGAVNVTAMDLYVAMMTNLSENELKELDKLQSDEEIMKKAEEMFTHKTGMSLDELAETIQGGALQAVVDAGEEK